MKNIMIAAAMLILLASCSDKHMSKNSDGSFTVNTTELCREITGYNGPVPVLVTIKNDVIQDVEILKNDETPSYFEDVKQSMLPKFRGLAIDKAATVDAVSGATFSSKALRKNVETAVSYYLENK